MEEQRWKDGRHTWAQRGRLDVRQYHVEPIEHGDGKAFVCAHHYKGSWPATRFVFGLFHTLPSAPFLSAQLVGVAAFGVSCTESVIPCWTGLGPREGVELSRFVLTDDVPHGGESRFNASALAQLRDLDPTLRAVLAYSDPLERRRADGVILKPGHFGTAYQAGNALYMGRTKPRPIYVGRATGGEISEKSIGKIKHDRKGREYAGRQLARLTGLAQRVGESGAAYVERVLASGALVKMKHPGNFAYTWPLVEELRPQLASIAGVAGAYREDLAHSCATLSERTKQARAWQATLKANAANYPKAKNYEAQSIEVTL